MDLAESVCKYAGQIERAKRQQTESAVALEAQKSAFEQLSNIQSSLQRRLDLISKERDSLKQVVALYQEGPGTQAPSAGAGSIKIAFSTILI